ncbi:anaerobic ribonucleoside-triphosphate reductase [Tyzzerella sp. An114]|uniref:anaerobic ribonucleoside triphosphate reductase n=1 Tax=Tyzzerella sp. An114 TaxID=1965545 RepID=UPI000B44731D|nr:anaerobic ribonucleoside triphosphate reductase [Tyzzerella sp. An114]OUQ58376.1 anaerobic ribonucleoside-triphosphate reductase [Tyzzerella sp. An114]HIT73786.1 anaerobic ribonucleoside triphosphate reductase [Candidatus Fimicola cottocaccae]
MVNCIKKRDGRLAQFDINKIADAISKAFEASTGKKEYSLCLDLAKQTVKEFDTSETVEPNVEQIQDAVEKVLIKNGFVSTAKSYILYRAERTRIRNMNGRLMKTFEDITYKDATDSDIKRENANIDGNTAMGAMLKYGSEGAKHFNEMYVLKPEFSEAHRNGDIHIHDLDFYTLTTTCCQIDILKLFKDGFSTGHGVLREPNDIASYSSLACIAIQSNQNDQHGGQSIVNFDYGLAPGVKKTYKKRYCQDLSSAIELICGEVTGPEIKKIHKTLIDKGLWPTLDYNEEYLKAEKEMLLDIGIDESIIEKCQKFARTKAEEETDKATYQAMESLIHNLNTMHSRAGAQTPFSSINYGMDTSTEGRMVVKNVLLVTEVGLGNGETPIFPIQIFRVKDGINFNPGEPNYDLFRLACRVSAKRLFPNFSFQDAPFNLQYYKGTPETEIAYMGCRTRVIGNVYDPEREISNGRGNLSFTTINLPRIAILAEKNIEWFYEELDRKIDLVFEQLLERFEIQAKKKVNNYPFLMGEGVWIDSEKLNYNDEVREILKHGTLSVGFIGLAECLKALIGVHHGESETAQALGLEIVGHMRRRMDEMSEKTHLNFSLLATPAEGLSGRFVKIDKKKFGIIEGITDKEYYTNSFHIPVYFPISAFKKIQLEAPYHALTNAGHISYVELDGDPAKNVDAFEKVVRYMKTQGIGYGSINHPVDRDPVCGYSGIIGDTCPKCGRTEDEGPKFQRIRRITGYLVGTLDRFNDAKRAEVRDRVKHSISMKDIK